MLRKSQRSSISVQNLAQNSKLEKKLRFNEENIQQTHHPVQKDYGFIAIPEAKTPFPRHGDPIAAEDLRKRLQESLDRANRMMLNDNTDDDDERTFNMDELQTPLASLDFEDQERRRTEFYKKRKQFYQSEYIIAQQKSMSSEIPEPGPSVGENWRIVNNDGNTSLPSNFNSFISNNRQSTVNYETLREIAEQMSSSSEQFI
ncbi:uncharacterized protein LOC119611596 [Lucilia sericata]|uniref:uncharacterized protein LOC119608611 n=1 Tax=Lucilia sericata TaxID=13632 RepID=UPI0018A83E85|nr:uncharacterized protein LOC119608611 [Lucilia sericata]XP_037823174.1 uncharacterized protein LOC119611596 [Lucilia sericata]